MCAKRRFLGYGMAVILGLVAAGCVGASLDDVANLFGKQRKFYDAAKEANADGRYYDAAMNLIEALKIKPDYADAKILLREVTPRAYQQRLAAVKEIEKTNPGQALEQYQGLKQFTNELAEFGVSIPAIDFNPKFEELELRIKNVKAADAEKAYADAGELFRKNQYDGAINGYRKALEFIPDYRDSKERIAECYYRLAMADLSRRQYRMAVEGFKKAEAERPAYKDSRLKAAKIYMALGSYFLQQGYGRNAVVDFEEAKKLEPNLPNIAPRIEQGRRLAVKRVAVVGVANRTGQKIEGMAVEDFIGDEIFDELQRRKSQFIEVYARTQLDAVVGELKFGLHDLVDKSSAAEVGKLKGVNYVVMGKITQVTERKAGPVVRRNQTSFRVPVYQPVTRNDRRGRPFTVQQHIGDRTEYVQYDEVSWSREIAFAGSISVLEVETGKILVSRNFNKRESAGGRWAENLSLPEARERLAPEIRQLFDAPRRAESADAMAKRVINALAQELVSATLENVDRTPNVPDPARELTGL